MAIYTGSEAEPMLSTLLDQALIGEQVFISRDGVPMIEVVPTSSSTEPQDRAPE